MVTGVPPAPDGLQAEAEHLARSATTLVQDIQSDDVWMALGGSSLLAQHAAELATRVREWGASVPAQPDPNVNPHEAVPLVGATMAEAVGALTEQQLEQLHAHLSWERDRHRVLPEARAWLDRTLALIEDNLGGGGPDPSRQRAASERPRAGLHLCVVTTDERFRTFFAWCETCAQASTGFDSRGDAKDLVALHLVDPVANPVTTRPSEERLAEWRAERESTRRAGPWL